MTRYSVVIPTYNRLGFLEKAVESVLAQSHTELELIIVDDGSTDGTDAYAAALRDPRVVFIGHEICRGVSAARNTGISASSGDFVAFLDSDDWWHEDKLKAAENAISDNSSFSVFHTQEIWYRLGVLLNQKKRHKKPHGDVFGRCLKLCCISMSTAVVRRTLFAQVGLFDEKLPACEDYDFWLRVSAGHPVCLIDRALTFKEGGRADQQSVRYPGMDRFRIASIAKLLDSGSIEGIQASAAVAELVRKIDIYTSGCLKRGKESEAAMYHEIADRYRSKYGEYRYSSV